MLLRAFKVFSVTVLVACLLLAAYFWRAYSAWLNEESASDYVIELTGPATLPTNKGKVCFLHHLSLGDSRFKVYVHDPSNQNGRGLHLYTFYDDEARSVVWSRDGNLIAIAGVATAASTTYHYAYNFKTDSSIHLDQQPIAATSKMIRQSLRLHGGALSPLRVGEIATTYDPGWRSVTNREVHEWGWDHSPER